MGASPLQCRRRLDAGRQGPPTAGAALCGRGSHPGGCLRISRLLAVLLEVALVLALCQARRRLVRE
eukprot:10044048-Alexandrium_andersonii.AAC.1